MLKKENSKCTKPTCAMFHCDESEWLIITKYMFTFKFYPHPNQIYVYIQILPPPQSDSGSILVFRQLKIHMKN